MTNTKTAKTHEQIIEEKNKEARKEIAKRLQRLTYYFTKDYVTELDNRKREIAAEQEMKAEAEKTGEVKCMVLTAEANAEIAMDCITDLIHAVTILTDPEQDVDDWMLDGISAMLDSVNQKHEGIPYDLSASICGLLCAQFR